MNRVRGPRDDAGLEVLGDWIQAARRAAGLSQAALADRLNVSRSSLQNWEQGRREIGALTLAKLAGAVGADLATLPGATAVAGEAPEKREPGDA